MRELDETVRVVYDTDGLADAVTSDNGVDYVFLGADIELAYGIEIYAGKTSLVIDGEYPEDSGITHTFIDNGTLIQSSTIGIRAASNIELTIKNMTIRGRNYFGVPCIYEGTQFNAVTVNYQNVIYSGPQMTWNPNGLTRYIDCDITIEYPSEPLRADEVGEVCRVELGGTVDIRHRSGDNAVFWFRGALNNAYLKVLPDARVNIQSNNYFMFAATADIIPIARPVAFEVTEGASFSLSTNTGFSFDSLHRVSSLTVRENASFRFIQSVPYLAFASLYLNGALEVEAGAEFYMQGDYTGGGQLIYFRTAGGSISINNPKSFVLYRRGAAALYFSNQIDYTFYGGQLNYWQTVQDFPLAGTFEDIPYRKWYKDEYAVFLWRGRVSSSSTTVTEDTFTVEEKARMYPLTDLELQNARVLSIGNLKLVPAPVIDDGRPITGEADASAKLRAEYNDGEAHTVNGEANPQGGFELYTDAPIPSLTEVKLLSNIPFLVIEMYVYSQEVGDITIISAPTLIRFMLAPAVSVTPLLLPREFYDDAVTVYDDRAISTKWALTAAIDGNLHTEDDDELPDAVVFRSSSGITALSQTPLEVFYGEPNQGTPKTTVCGWAQNMGILLHVSEPIIIGKYYTARLVWDVKEI